LEISIFYSGKKGISLFYSGIRREFQLFYSGIGREFCISIREMEGNLEIYSGIYFGNFHFLFGNSLEPSLEFNLQKHIILTAKYTKI